MSVGDGRGSGGAHLAGREFVIVMVVFFSSLTFTLGFFVGKKSAGNTGDQRPAAVQAGGQGVVQQSPPPHAVPQAVAPAAVPVDHAQARPEREVPRPEPTGTPLPAAAGADEGRQAKSPVGQPPEAAGEKKPAAVTASADPPEAAAVYTVQLGALKNQSEARRLKEKYAKKGYKTYIRVTRTKKKEKIYKVRAGEFHSRQDAELFALKLQKTAGLHVFVTLKDE
ncbi:MAG: SPOR domain-containing protein [Nitrospiraceae bacterium]|nr:SPOR domain-containing protein [Nitrospiraceae bacterium]